MLSNFLNSLPSFQVTDYINYLKAMRITTESGELPCKIDNATKQEKWDIPAEPTDVNTYINDTLIIYPFTINASVFVNEKDLQKFKELLKDGQNSKNGFTFIMLNGSYGKLRLINISMDENSESSNGYYYYLQFQEVILAQPKIGTIVASKVSNKSFASVENQGKKVPAKKDSSVLSKLLGIK